MSRPAGRQFVGFGLGPIQLGLFLWEARRSGFGRLTVAEVDAGLVEAVHANGGRCTINIAHRDGVEKAELTGLELHNPTTPAGRAELLAAIAEADELATALPSVQVYRAGGPASPAALLAEGLAGRPADRPAVLYAAENHNHAATLLNKAVAEAGNGTSPPALNAVDTVIGKMSGAIDDPATIDRLNLAALTPGLATAVLVEAFNAIRVSAPAHPAARVGIAAFGMHENLLPYEEAKLYGHNAIHALIGYLAAFRGLDTIAQAGRDEWIMAQARRAFTVESAAAVLSRNRHVDDPLFTPAGYTGYAEDLLGRMTSPYLNDRVERVIRDPARKLGYDDRLIGTMRYALAADVEPECLATAAAAAVLSMIEHGQDRGGLLPPSASAEDLAGEGLANMGRQLWGDRAAEAGGLIERIEARLRYLLNLAARQ